MTAGSRTLTGPDICEYLGKLYAARLTLQDVENYRSKRFAEITRRGGPPAPATIDRELALLKKCLNHAVACGKLSKNPIAPVGLLRKPNARRMVVKEQTLERILEHTQPALRPAFVLAYETGMRKREVSFLRFSRVDFEAGCIRLHAGDTKTDEARVVYLTERALQAIRSVPRQLHGEFVFVNPETGKPWDDLNRHLQKACRRAGLEGIVFHDLRRSFVTNARRRGVPESVVMKLSGHRTRNVFERYNIVDENDLREAVLQIERGRLGEASQEGAIQPISCRQGMSNSYRDGVRRRPRNAEAPRAGAREASGFWRALEDLNLWPSDS
jgi:integrase